MNSVAADQSVSRTPPAPYVLDVRAIFEKGESPCGAIDAAVARLLPSQALVLLVPFEPLPLYTKLGQQGFRHQSRKEPDGSWRVEFQR